MRRHGSVCRRRDAKGRIITALTRALDCLFEVLIRLVREHGFHLAQEFFWHNSAKPPAPAEWVTVRRIRVKDSVETLWWLSKSTQPKADNRKVLTVAKSNVRHQYL